MQLNGKDLHSLPLIARKKQLRKLIPNHLSSLLYVDHIEARGEDLFRLACREDLEGVVAKRKDGTYGLRGDWVKIKNSAYSQIVGRNELFEKRSARQRASPSNLRINQSVKSGRAYRLNRQYVLIAIALIRLAYTLWTSRV